MSEPTGDARAVGTARRPQVGMTIRTYRVGPDGQRTGYTPTVVVPSTPKSARTATPGLPPCRCPRCRPQGRGAGS